MNHTPRKRDIFTYVLALGLGLIIGTAAIIDSPDQPSGAKSMTEKTCTEDMGCFNCEVDGNGICGPLTAYIDESIYLLDEHGTVIGVVSPDNVEIGTPDVYGE